MRSTIAGRISASILLLCLAIASVEAFVVLVVLGVNGREILGGDGPGYEVMAQNLIHHGVFSGVDQAPYPASVYRSPGYPAIIAALELVGLGSTVTVRVVQFALLGLTGWVVGLIALGVAGRRTAVVAAVLCTTYLPFVWLSTYQLTEVSAGLAGAVLVLLLLKARDAEPPSPLLWAAAGLTLAVGAYIRPSFMLLVAPVAALAVLTGRGGWGSRARWIGPVIMSAVFVAVLLPWTARNLALTDRLIPLSAASGGSLYASAAQYNGDISYQFNDADWQAFAAQSEDVVRVGDEYPPGWQRELALDDAYREQGKELAGELSANQVLGSIPKREAYLWSPADYPPPGSSYTLLHRLGQLQYLALGLLLVVGLVLRRRRLLADWPLWIGAAYLAVLHLVFHIESRYSVPARAVLLVIAAWAAVTVVDRVRDRERSPVVAQHAR
jgi:membrane protein implicated in regulation of membrane protease activity